MRLRGDRLALLFWTWPILATDPCTRRSSVELTYYHGTIALGNRAFWAVLYVIQWHTSSRGKGAEVC
jgi:hypothetical protein